MSGDNGQIPEKKTPEELAIEKRKAFEIDPDQFVHMSELIIAVRKGEKGIETLINPESPVNVELSLTRLTRTAYLFLQSNDMKNREQKIVPAKGSMLNFARSKFLKKG